MTIVLNIAKSFNKVSKAVDILANGINSRNPAVKRAYLKAIYPLVEQVHGDLNYLSKISLNGLLVFLSEDLGQDILDLLSEVNSFLDENEDEDLKASAGKAYCYLEEIADELAVLAV